MKKGIPPEYEELFNQKLEERSNKIMKKYEKEIKNLQTQNTNLNTLLATYKDQVKDLTLTNQSERQDGIVFMRQYRDMEATLKATKEKNEQLQKDLEDFKKSYEESYQGTKKKEIEIEKLQQEIALFEARNVKHRQDQLDSIAQNHKLKEDSSRYQAHIQDLDQAIESLLERNKQLSNSLTKANERIYNLEQELVEKNMRIEGYEKKLYDNQKVDRPSRSFNKFGVNGFVSQISNTSDQELLKANNTILELRGQLEEKKKRMSQ